MPAAKPYLVRDCQTGAIVGGYKSRAAATRRADKLDNAYGAYRYRVVNVALEAEIAAKREQA